MAIRKKAAKAKPTNTGVRRVIACNADLYERLRKAAKHYNTSIAGLNRRYVEAGLKKDHL